MKILFVTLMPLETNTSVTISNIGILKGFYDLGYDIEILMPELDSSLNYFDSSFDLSCYKVTRIKSNNLSLKVASITSKSLGIKKKILLFLRDIYYKIKLLDKGSIYFKKISSLKLKSNYYDYIISTSNPKSSHIFVDKMIKSGLKYGKWIQHWGDPLASDISQKSIYPKKIIKYYEKKIIKNSDRIIYVSPFTLNIQKTFYKSEKNKMKFIPLPYNIEELKKYNKNLKSSENFKFKKYNIVYLGDYNSNVRNIFPLYNACQKLNFISLTIAGNSDLQLIPKKNIKILPRLPYNEVKEIEKNADIIVSIGNRKGNQIPGKIYYAASSDKIILVTIDGDYKKEMREYLNSFKRFECCDNLEEDIINKINEIIQKKNKNDIKIPEKLNPLNISKEILKEL